MRVAYYRTEDGKLFTATARQCDPIEDMVRDIREAHTILSSRNRNNGHHQDAVEEILAELLRKYEPIRERLPAGVEQSDIGDDEYFCSVCQKKVEQSEIDDDASEGFEHVCKDCALEQRAQAQEEDASYERTANDPRFR